MQKWLPFEDIYDDGLIKMSDRSIVKIINVEPINYSLKSDFEKETLLNSYRLFLKTCNFDIQILIQSNKENINKNIEKMYNKKNNNSKKLNTLIDDYCDFIKKINHENKSSIKKFFILIKNTIPKNNNIDIAKEELNANYIKIKECLLRCGNVVNEVTTKEETKKIIYSFINTKKYINSFV